MNKKKITAQITSIVKNIKQVRMAKGFSQQYMGGKLGCSQNAYSKLELGQTDITVERILELSEIFDLPVIALLEPAA